MAPAACIWFNVGDAHHAKVFRPDCLSGGERVSLPGRREPPDPLRRGVDGLARPEAGRMPTVERGFLPRSLEVPRRSLRVTSPDPWATPAERCFGPDPSAAPKDR